MSPMTLSLLPSSCFGLTCANLEFRRLRIDRIVPAAMIAREHMTPMIVPAMIPAGDLRVWDPLAKAYRMVKSSVLIALTVACPSDAWSVGGTSGRRGVVMQGVEPARAAVYIDHPL